MYGWKDVRFGGPMQGMIQMWAGDWVITWEDEGELH